MLVTPPEQTIDNNLTGAQIALHIAKEKKHRAFIFKEYAKNKDPNSDEFKALKLYEEAARNQASLWQKVANGLKDTQPKDNNQTINIKFPGLLDYPENVSALFTQCAQNQESLIEFYHNYGDFGFADRVTKNAAAFRRLAEKANENSENNQ